MEQFLIEVKNVSKSFKGMQVLNDVNMTCSGGKIYGIVGYNGSGKTVLFKCICGFLHVDSGEISVNGREMGKEIDMLEHAGIIIEEPGYIRSLSGSLLQYSCAARSGTSHRLVFPSQSH